MPFNSFSCPVVLTRTSYTLVNRSGESGQPCIIPDLGGKAFGLWPLSMMLALGPLKTPFIMWKKFSSVSSIPSCFCFCFLQLILQILYPFASLNVDEHKSLGSI